VCGEKCLRLGGTIDLSLITPHDLDPVADCRIQWRTVGSFHGFIDQQFSREEICHRFPATAAEQANLAVADLSSRSSDDAPVSGKDDGGLPCSTNFVVPI
jgi:hypothetical protein